MAQQPHVVVIGSINFDMVSRLPTLPAAGETKLGSDFYTNIGGKGANQAVAAARCGAKVSFIGCVGDDDFGKQALNVLADNNVDTTSVKVTNKCSTGVASIFVDNAGNNMIGVIPAANHKLTIDDIHQNKDLLKSADCVLMRLEIPLEVIDAVVAITHELDCTTILNPAPAAKLSKNTLSKVDIITPNEVEAGILTNVSTDSVVGCKVAAKELINLGCPQVLITLGQQGSYLMDAKQDMLIDAFNVKAVYTTAAGDTFNGALAYSISIGKNLDEAIYFANAAAALSVTKVGALQSAPYLKDIKSLSAQKNCR